LLLRSSCAGQHLLVMRLVRERGAVDHNLRAKTH
jgi:hypothetical protein